MANFFSRQHTYILRLKSNQNLSMKRFSYKTPCNRVTYSPIVGAGNCVKEETCENKRNFGEGEKWHASGRETGDAQGQEKCFFLYYWARRLPRARERNGVRFEEMQVKQKTREDKINVCLAFARLLPARVRGRNGVRVEELRVKLETREDES